MASLRVLEDEPSRLVLGKGGGNAIGSLIGIVIFGIVACGGLATMLGEGGEFNPVMLVIVLVIGLVGVVSLINSIVSTRVVLDADQRVAARTDSFLFIPTGHKSLAFNAIRDVAVTSPRTPDALSFDFSPIWQVNLRAADGSTLVLNERGTRAEMDALAEQAGRLVGRPIQAKAGSASQPAAPYAAAGVFGALTENLTAFAQSLGPAGAATTAPTFSAFADDSPDASVSPSTRPSPDSPYLQASARMTAQQVARGAPNAATNAQMAVDTADAFSSDVQTQLRMSGAQAAAGASTAATNARMAADTADAFSSDVQTQLRMSGAQAAAGASSDAANAQMAANRASAFSADVQIQNQMSGALALAGVPMVTTNVQMAANRAGAFSTDLAAQARTAGAQVAAGTPFTEASARLAQQQAEGQAAMGFSMPSMLTMPDMPPMLSMGPSITMPSFAPIGITFEVMASPLPVEPETKPVAAHETESSPDNSQLFVQARKLLGTRNYRDAEKAYLAALSTNPADAAAQNDLGVVYFAENKLNDAQSAFRRAMALDPFHLEARYNLGLVLQRSGKRAEAREVFRVSAQTAGREGSRHFQEALRGVVHDPLPSSSR